ncbi:MAG: hypothetical protein HYT09_00815 [Candidatus Levybacteria bacterium]|nr:hypothetical protein [Candidatus Levybacteria bacterium]
MSFPEDPKTPRDIAELGLVMPSLVPPYLGVFDEVLADYSQDPSVFKVALEHRMGIDNPNLIAYIDPTRPMQDSELSIKWSSIYYEIFARSARKAGGVPMPVTDRVKDEYHLNRRRSHPGFTPGTVAQGADWVLSEIEKRKKRRERDEALSPELKMFWEMVDRDIEAEVRAGKPMVIGDIYILGVQALQAILQAQHDLYAGSSSISIN